MLWGVGSTLVLGRADVAEVAEVVELVELVEGSELVRTAPDRNRDERGEAAEVVIVCLPG